MRKLRTLVLTITASVALAGVSACAGKMKTGTEHDPSAVFAEYTSYAWVTEDLVLLIPGTGNENIRNEENEKRIRAAVEAKLEAAGMTKVDKAEAGLVVMFAVGTRERPEVGGLSFEFGAAPATYTEGTLQIDLFDGASNKHVWHGWASSALRPGDDPEEVTRTAVDAIFTGFPPS
jgi:hypothetical protein